MILDDRMSDKMDLVAKNLLQEKTCDDCYYMMQQDIKRCYSSIAKMYSKEPLVCPEVNTCDYWEKKTTIPDVMEFLELV